MTEHKKIYVFQSNMGGHEVHIEDWNSQSAYEQVQDYICSPKLVDIIDSIKEV